MLAASIIALSRVSIACKRPGGVSGVSAGQAACRTPTALTVASPSLSSSACCLSFGAMTSSICSIGRLVRPGLASPHFLASSALADCASGLIGAFDGPIWLKRSFCSSLSEELSPKVGDGLIF